MKRLLFLLVLISSTVGGSYGQKPNSSSEQDRKIINEIKRLMDYELKLVLNQDITTMEKIYPDELCGRVLE